MMNPEPSGGTNQQTPRNDDSPWWLKHAVKVLGIVTALAALALGALACVTLTPRCLLAGILQMLIGVLVALIEAPFLCMFLDFAQVPANYFDQKPPWHRGLLYIVISIIPISLCGTMSTFFGSGLVFVTGSLYGILALGRKAPSDQMRMQASSSYNLLQNSKAGDAERGDQPDPNKTGRPI